MKTSYHAENALQISWNEKGNRYTMQAEGTPLMSSENADYFRIMIDDGYLKEITIPSHLQEGTVTEEGNITTIFFPQLVDESNRVFHVEFTVYMEKREDALCFSSKINNQDSIRVNEVQLPLLDFSHVCNEDHSKDVLYRGHGMGERIFDPWTALESAHTEYMAGDYHEIWSPLTYPKPMNMAWMGLQSGEHFLYIGRHDDEQYDRICVMNVGRNPRFTAPRLLFAVCHFPLAQQGEVLDIPHSIVSLSKGDWRDGSARYRAWAESCWYHGREKRNWVKKFTGWQRIILRHQYGEIFWKYKDLVDVYEHGKKYGIDSLMVFGWWKGRFDNGYPLYEIDEELGGEEELRKAIAEIQRRGGNVILYTNGIQMDLQSDFYKRIGKDVHIMDLDGNPHIHHYPFSDRGTAIRVFGYKSFAIACNGTDAWRNQLIHNAKTKLAFKPNSIFFDQMGGTGCELCFNEAHKHGKRGDMEAHYRIENFRELNTMLGEDQAIGIENVGDIFSPYMDYFHGCDFGNWGYSRTAYPQLYLNTFPEIIITNRFAQDERDDYKFALNYALLCGYRFDVSLYRCRKIDMSGAEKYSAHLQRILDFKEKHHRFFYPSKFSMQELPEMPSRILMTQYVDGNDNLVLILNSEKEPRQITFRGKAYTIPGWAVLSVFGDETEVIEGLD